MRVGIPRLQPWAGSQFVTRLDHRLDSGLHDRMISLMITDTPEGRRPAKLTEMMILVEYRTRWFTGKFTSAVGGVLDGLRRAVSDHAS